MIRSSARVLTLAVPLAVAVLSPAARAQLSPLHGEGTRWFDGEGRKVVLRGVNLGNWLVQEMWMHCMKLDGIPDQYTLEDVLAARFGKAGAEALEKAYRDNFIVARDFAVIRSFGMNVVRLPFVYTVLMDDAHPYAIRPDGWSYLDWAIDQAEARGIYTIVDLHGAPGRQSAMDHTGRAGFNRLFFDKVYQDQTVWLWGQIAARYRGRGAVAAYDILNEAWGSSKDDLKAVALRIFAAIRAVDPDHLVILPSYSDGFEFYGRPAEAGLTGAVNNMHFYPGLFGWGSPDVATNRDWLTGAVFGWRDRAGAMGVPFIVGEMDVVARAAGGGEMMRHSYDTYGGLSWGTAMWAYKVFTAAGGIGADSWGMTTNPPGAGAPRIQADTWNCDGWDGPFAQACVNDFVTFAAPGEGPATVYLILKAGACCGGSVDVLFDGVSLKDDDTGEEEVTNGGFGGSSGWTAWTASGAIERDFAYSAARPAGGSEPVLRLHGAAPGNGGVYQALTLEGGRVYRLGGVFRDLGSSPQAAWGEVYLRSDRPVDGVDSAAGTIAGTDVDINTSSEAKIREYFESLSTMDLVIDDDLKDWLTTARKPALFTPPVFSDWWAFGSHEGWQTPGTDMVETSPGSRLYSRRITFAASPILDWWKARRTDSSEEYPGGNGVDAWVKSVAGVPIDLLFDEDRHGDGWSPDAHFLYQRPVYVAKTYVAVGNFQSRIGDTDWNANSTITAMSDDGKTKGDAVAGDHIYTLEVAIPSPGAYLFTGVLVDRSWQTRITAISATGDTSAGEVSFRTTARDQKVRFLCDIDRNRVKVEVLPKGRRRPGDANGDGRLDISDAVWILGYLYLGQDRPLPCSGAAGPPGAGDRALLDVNGDSRIDLSDALAVLTYLYLGGAPPSLGADCVLVDGCPEACAP